jgi:hypothetical protein
VTVILSVLAWELEILALAVHFFAGKRVDQAGHVVLIAASAIMTLFAYSKGKREIARVRNLGARAAMTWFQAIMVVGVVVAFAGLLALFGSWQADGR